MSYVAHDISGRTSPDLPSIAEVKDWMHTNNRNNGDCVIWAKPNSYIAAVRINDIWITFSAY